MSDEIELKNREIIDTKKQLRVPNIQHEHTCPGQIIIRNAGPAMNTLTFNVYFLFGKYCVYVWIVGGGKTITKTINIFGSLPS